MIKHLLTIGGILLTYCKLHAQTKTYDVSPVMHRLRMGDMVDNRVVFDGIRYNLPGIGDSSCRVRSLLKQDDKIFATLDGSGHVFAMLEDDSADIRWQRMDSSTNSGFYHNHQAIWFRDRVHLFGGRGLGHVNGDLRRLEKNGEWTFLPVNQNFPFFGDLFLGGDVTKKIWLICPPHIVANTNTLFDKYAVGVIELTEGDVQVLGYIDKKSTIQPTRTLFASSSLKGLIVASQKEVWLLKIPENKAYRLKDHELSEWLLKNHQLGTLPMWESNKIVYRFDPENNRIDSIKFDRASFESKGIAFYSRAEHTYIWGAGFLLILTGIGGYALLRAKKRRDKKQVVKDEIPGEEMTLHQVTKSIQIHPIDRLLIEGIIEKMSKDEKFTVSDMNRLLGVRRKSEIIQKKTRREAIIRINNAFRELIPGDGDLIEHRRSAEDKRYFNYHIHPNNARLAKEWMK